MEWKLTIGIFVQPFYEEALLSAIDAALKDTTPEMRRSPGQSLHQRPKAWAKTDGLVSRHR